MESTVTGGAEVEVLSFTVMPPNKEEPAVAGTAGAGTAGGMGGASAGTGGT